MINSTALTANDCNALRAALIAKQAELGGRDHGRSALAIEAASDEADRNQQSQERDFAIGSLDRNSALLSEVRGALERIQAGTYGVCADCDEAIGVRRLAALPWAASCIVCRNAAEQLTADYLAGGGREMASTATEDAA